MKMPHEVIIPLTDMRRATTNKRYPGEELKTDVTPLTVVIPNQALKLRASLDCEDHNGVKRVAGDEWLFLGPGTYTPKVGVGRSCTNARTRARAHARTHASTRTHSRAHTHALVHTERKKKRNRESTQRNRTQLA